MVLIQSLLRRMRGVRVFVRTREGLKVLLFALAFITFAAVGFYLAERPQHPEYSALDGLWWAVVTMTTVGYGDISPETTVGRFLVAFPAMLAGGGVIAYGLSTVTTWLIEQKHREIRGMNALALKDHVLLVNYPGPSKLLDMLDELRSDEKNSSRAVVLLTDSIDELPAELVSRDLRFVHGAPINEAALHRACVVDANRIIVFAPQERDENSDSANLGVVVGLMATETRARVVVECVAPSHKRLMLKAGASLAVCVTELSTLLLAQASQGEGMQELFADLASNRTPQQVDAVRLRLDGSSHVGFGTLADALASDEIILIGVRRGDEQIVNPGRRFDLKSHDELLVISSARPREIAYPR